MKRILLADDHKVFIHGLKYLMSSSEEYQVVAEAGNGEEVLHILEKEEIDIVLLDINMPVLNGYHTAQNIISQYPNVKIVVLSMLADESSVQKMLEVGVHGYLFKNAGEEEIYEALDEVIRGNIYVTKEINLDMVLPRNKEGQMVLSSREIEICRYILEGLTNPEISEKLFLSVRTVETHRKNILAKLKVKNTAALVKFLMDNKPFMGL